MGIIGQKKSPDNLKYFKGTQEEFQNFVKSLSGISLILISSPKICPCKELEINVSELARQFPKVTIIKIDVFENVEMIDSTFKVEGLPFLQLLEVKNCETKLLCECLVPSIEGLKELLSEYTQ